eukprot:TRINITY_DN4165_c0_g1_i1.p1 TRINITY_DN4165_c0_g1~~TRINITY_DN4165_c0_g1_i1.p1  ORF type:complete len:554 (+),score=126.39 TRINITY_DN4165_c0_g1_i1:69-1664(+)
MFAVSVRMPQGAAVAVEVAPHSTAADVMAKVRAKLSGVRFRDEVTQKEVELFSFGAGLHCSVDGSPWRPSRKQERAHGALHPVHQVELDGRLLRLGGRGCEGVTLPRAPDRAQEARLLARLRRVLDHSKARHNLPRRAPPSAGPASSPVAGLDAGSNSGGRRRELTALDGHEGWTAPGSGYVHQASCGGDCGDCCRPRAQPAQSDGALLRGAAARGDCAAIAQQLRRGTPVDAAAGPSGMSPLHFAARHGHEPAVRLLLSVGAYARLPDRDGLTPADHARSAGHTGCAALLANALRPCGESFPGEWQHPASPGRAGPRAVRQQREAQGARRSTTGAQGAPQLSQRPWLPGEEVAVIQDASTLEAECRENWAGWCTRKAFCAGKSGVVADARPAADQAPLVLVAFDPDAAAGAGEWWLPASALRSPPGLHDAGDGLPLSSPRAASPRRGLLHHPPSPRMDEQWRLLFAGRELRDWESMAECGVAQGDALQLLRRGGGYRVWGAGGQPPHAAPRRPPLDALSPPRFTELGFDF